MQYVQYIAAGVVVLRKPRETYPVLCVLSFGVFYTLDVCPFVKWDLEGIMIYGKKKKDTAGVNRGGYGDYVVYGFYNKYIEYFYT